MNKETLYFFEMIRDFLNTYLPRQKAVSDHTVKSYKTALNQFLDFSSKKLCKPLCEFTFNDTDVALIESFLLYGEDELLWSISTRNLKLAAVRSFYRYAANHDIALVACYQNLMTIPEKKDFNSYEVDFFSESALKTILEQPDTSLPKELRNLMIMILLYDSGGRIQEILDLTLNDLHFNENTPYVSLTGKGKKTRLVPLMEKTVSHLKQYILKFHPDSKGDNYLFYTVHNGCPTKMSQDNVQKFIDRYAILAREKNPEVPQHVYCHMFRHSRAMHLYRNGMPLPLVSEWLGHVQINTTRKFYANADTRMKKEAIDAATSKMNPVLIKDYDFDFTNDEQLLKKLYGLM